MRVCEVSRQTIFTYRDTVVAKGVAGLLQRKWKGARQPVVRGAVADEFIQRLETGQFRQARDAQAWIKKRTRQSLSESGVRKILRRLGGKLKVPRKSHAKKDPAKAAKFKRELPHG
jgi:transposase